MLALPFDLPFRVIVFNDYEIFPPFHMKTEIVLVVLDSYLIEKWHNPF